MSSYPPGFHSSRAAHDDRELEIGQMLTELINEAVEVVGKSTGLVVTCRLAHAYLPTRSGEQPLVALCILGVCKSESVETLVPDALRTALAEIKRL